MTAKSSIQPHEQNFSPNLTDFKFRQETTLLENSILDKKFFPSNAPLSILQPDCLTIVYPVKLPFFDANIEFSPIEISTVPLS